MESQPNIVKFDLCPSHDRRTGTTEVKRNEIVDWGCRASPRLYDLDYTGSPILYTVWREKERYTKACRITVYHLYVEKRMEIQLEINEMSGAEIMLNVNYSGCSFREEQREQYPPPLDERNTELSEHLQSTKSWTFEPS